MNWAVIFGGITAAVAILAVLITIAKLLSNIQSELSSKLSKEEHNKICEKRDDSLKADLADIKKILEAQDDRAIKTEERHANFRHKTAGDLQVLTVKMAVMEAVAKLPDKTLSVQVNNPQQ